MSARETALSAAFILFFTAALADAQPDARELKKARLLHGTAIRGNGTYTAYVEDYPGFGVGLYTATTGPIHPAGDRLNVLYGAGVPGTSFNTVRSFTTSTDYVAYPDTGWVDTTPGYRVVSIDPYGSVEPLGTAGLRVTYDLPGPPQTPDKLVIVMDVNVNGAGFLGSSVDVTTFVENTGAAPVALGIRYLWDFQIGSPGMDGDDGPTFQELSPTGAVLGAEAEFENPGFQAYRIVDNDENPSPPTFFILGTVTGPPGLQPAPTPPDRLQYVCWPTASWTAFDYFVDPGIEVATDGPLCGGAGGDSAVLYYFGPDPARALRIEPGHERTVSASLYLTPPELTALVDVKPGSCPNPFNVRSAGVLPAAIVSAPEFDARRVDPSTVTLAGVRPLRTAVEDVAAPFVPSRGQGAPLACGTEGPDGLADLTLKFDSLQVARAIESQLGRPPRDREVVPLTVSGKLKAEFGATPFTGSDAVTVIRQGR